jgi:hypothetical protein
MVDMMYFPECAKNGLCLLISCCRSDGSKEVMLLVIKL